jgi:hypothetical protein
MNWSDVGVFVSVLFAVAAMLAMLVGPSRNS